MGINACQAMTAGGTLVFRVRRIFLDELYCRMNNQEISPGEYCKIEIEDTGAGIHPDIISRIFDPFFTTKGFGKGTGLGLSSAYGVIKKHHGFIHVYSEVNIGTVFHIYIPSMERGEVDFSEEELIMGSGRILLVDDEYLVRITTEALLLSLGYNVVTAGNGAEAIDAFRKNDGDFDLVITDMIMPGMTGRELAHELRMLERDCKILLSSGFSNDDKAEIADDRNLSGFIQKPL